MAIILFSIVLAGLGIWLGLPLIVHGREDIRKINQHDTDEYLETLKPKSRTFIKSEIPLLRAKAHLEIATGSLFCASGLLMVLLAIILATK